MKKVILLFALCTVFPAFADDAATVAERTDCDAMRDEIAQLIKIENPDDATAARLTEIQKISRRNCTKRTGTRRTSGRTGALPVAAASELNIQALDETAAGTMEATGATTDEKKDETPELNAETIAANIEAGLCADGEKPNKFGCCAGETFKDLGDLVFACCKDDSDECFPPIEK